MAYSAIDIGPLVINRTAIALYGGTRVYNNNTANATGVLTVFETWFVTTGSGLKMGTFSGGGTSYDDRDYESIGNVTAGSKQTFTGKNCDVSSGDKLGAYWLGGYVEATGGVVGGYIKEGDQFGSGSRTYGTYNNEDSFCATGVTVPDAPTSVSATDNLTDKVTITWTPGTGETGGHRVYRDGGDISGVVANGTSTYDDTTAVAGTTYSYTVKSINAAGLSAASIADNGIIIKPKIIIF